MSPSEINIAIARHLGWRFTGDPELDAYTEGWYSSSNVWAAPPSVDLSKDNQSLVFVHSIPNYSGDLNAMHEAEMSLDEWDKANMASKICSIHNGWKHGNTITGARYGLSATAIQRAEAFLYTVSKWKEGA